MERRSLDLPFRVVGRDLGAAEGHRLRVVKARNTLLTEPGELPWRSRFGAGLSRLRHRRQDDVLVELARVMVRDALRTWAPSVELTSMSLASRGEELRIRIELGDRDTGATSAMELRT